MRKTVSIIWISIISLMIVGGAQAQTPNSASSGNQINKDSIIYRIFPQTISVYDDKGAKLPDIAVTDVKFGMLRDQWYYSGGGSVSKYLGLSPRNLLQKLQYTFGYYLLAICLGVYWINALKGSSEGGGINFADFLLKFTLCYILMAQPNFVYACARSIQLGLAYEAATAFNTYYAQNPAANNAISSSSVGMATFQELRQACIHNAMAMYAPAIYSKSVEVANNIKNNYPSDSVASTMMNASLANGTATGTESVDQATAKAYEAGAKARLEAISTALANVNTAGTHNLADTIMNNMEVLLGSHPAVVSLLSGLQKEYYAALVDSNGQPVAGTSLDSLKSVYVGKLNLGIKAVTGQLLGVKPSAVEEEGVTWSKKAADLAYSFLVSLTSFLPKVIGFVYFIFVGIVTEWSVVIAALLAPLMFTKSLSKAAYGSLNSLFVVSLTPMVAIVLYGIFEMVCVKMLQDVFTTVTLGAI